MTETVEIVKLKHADREQAREKLREILAKRNVPINLAALDAEFKGTHDIYLTELAEIWHSLRSETTRDQTIDAIIKSFAATLESRNRMIVELQEKIVRQKQHLISGRAS